MRDTSLNDFPLEKPVSNILLVYYRQVLPINEVICRTNRARFRFPFEGGRRNGIPLSKWRDQDNKGENLEEIPSPVDTREFGVIFYLNSKPAQ